MHHIVLLNGPPYSGKDLGAEALRIRHGFTTARFSDPLKRAVPAFYGHKHADLEPTKDEIDKLYPYTYRQVQISLSEDWAKIYFGKTIFGDLAAKMVRRRADVQRWVFPDSGFQPEVDAFVAELRGFANIMLVRVIRPGFDFSNDSRGYVDVPPGADYSEITNGSSIHSYTSELQTMVNRWIMDTHIGRIK